MKLRVHVDWTGAISAPALVGHARRLDVDKKTAFMEVRQEHHPRLWGMSGLLIGLALQNIASPALDFVRRNNPSLIVEDNGVYLDLIVPVSVSNIWKMGMVE